MLTDQHINTVKSTIPLLASAGPALTAHFYQRMFAHNPELQDIFNMSNQKNGRQPAALFEAIAAYAHNIDNVQVLEQAIERIAQKHTSLHIQPMHYGIVGHHLIETLRELAPDAFTAEVEEAWTHAYNFLAQVFISRESELYTLRGESNGGWKGARSFIVKEKKAESKWVTSFILQAKDQCSIIDFLPGQYLGVEVTPLQAQYKEIRQYSLSDTPNGHTYRISVKREANDIPGVVSNYLHDWVNEGDEVKAYAPAGDFYFQDRQAPVALISAGVGITPMQSILESLAKQAYDQPVHYLHACESHEQHSFPQRTRDLVKANSWRQTVWYRTGQVQDQDTLGGMMNLADLELPFGNGDFYLCGPVPFMKFAKTQLTELGVSEERIHYEVFGPHDNL